MKRVGWLITTAISATVIVVALAVAASSRPGLIGAAPGGSVVPDPTSQPSNEAASTPSPETPQPGPTLTPPPLTIPDNIPDIALEPSMPPQPLEGECRTVGSFVDRAPIYMEERFHLSDGAALATVAEIGPSRWNTPEGEPPDDWREVAPSDVIRLIRFSAIQVWKGEVDGSFVAALQGGEIGCWTFQPDPNEVPEVGAGDQFALFFRGSPSPTGLEQAHKILTILPVDAEGRVITPNEGTLTSNELAEIAMHDDVETEAPNSPY